MDPILSHLFMKVRHICKGLELSCEIQKTWFYKYHWQCSGRFNFTIQLLDGQHWDDWAPTLTAPTKPPVCSRHLAILWSLEKGEKGWGEERRRGDWKGRNWVRLGGCGIGSRLWVPQRKIWWPARRNSLLGATHLLPLLLHFSLDNLL